MVKIYLFSKNLRYLSRYDWIKRKSWNRKSINSQSKFWIPIADWKNEERLWKMSNSFAKYSQKQLIYERKARRICERGLKGDFSPKK